MTAGSVSATVPFIVLVYQLAEFREQIAEVRTYLGICGLARRHWPKAKPEILLREWCTTAVTNTVIVHVPLPAFWQRPRLRKTDRGAKWRFRGLLAPVGRLWAGFWGVLGGTLGSLCGLLRPLGWFLGSFLALDAVRHGFSRILAEIRVRSWGQKINILKSKIVKIEDPRGCCKKSRF